MCVHSSQSVWLVSVKSLMFTIYWQKTNFVWGKILFLNVNVSNPIRNYTNHFVLALRRTLNIDSPKLSIQKYGRFICKRFLLLDWRLNEESKAIQWKRVKKVIPITAHQLWNPLKRWPLDFLNSEKISFGNSCSERRNTEKERLKFHVLLQFFLRENFSKFFNRYMC